jgi:hypothetical protein
VSNFGFMVDPLNFKAIIKLLPPRTIIQLQSLQGKEFFLYRFVAKYSDITKGFMRFLKKGVPFVWDDQAQRSFDILNKALLSTPLLSPPNYTRDFFLYLVTS